MVVKDIENQKTNSIISLFGGKTKEELLKRYGLMDKIEAKIAIFY